MPLKYKTYNLVNVKRGNLVIKALITQLHPNMLFEYRGVAKIQSESAVVNIEFDFQELEIV